MNFNIDYLMQHISYELHTIIKNWTDTLSSQTKPEVVCARKDISDEYLPFSVFTDSILNAEDTFNLANNPLIFSAGTASIGRRVPASSGGNRSPIPGRRTPGGQVRIRGPCRPIREVVQNKR